MRQGRVGIPALALLASLLAHAGFLSLGGRSIRRGPPAAPIELELVDVPPVVAAVPGGEAFDSRPPDPGPGRRARVTAAGAAPRSPGGRRGTAVAVPAPGPGAAGATAPVSPGPPSSGLPPAGVSPPAEPGIPSPDPGAPAGSSPAEARATVLGGREPDLSLRWPAFAALGEGGGGAAGEGEAGEPGGAASEPPEAERLARRVEQMLVADVPFRRARESADPYWFGVKARLEREFVVPAEVVEDRPGGGFGPQTREAARNYLARAERFGKGGSPWGDPEYAPHAAAIPDFDAELPQFERKTARQVEPGEDATRVVTWVRVVFAEDGAVASIALDRSSGVPAHDRLALEAARSLPNLGPRPADQSTTLWAFETALWIVPPAPVAGCAFDSVKGLGPCFYPLKRMVRSRVRLEAVE